MKKYLIIIGIIAVGIVVFGFIIPPPDGFFGAVDDTTIAKLQEKYSVAPKEIKDKYVLENGTLKATPKPDEKDLIEVWIGNKPTEKLGAITNFEPTLTIARWDSEVEFSIKPIAFDSVALKDRTLKFDKEKTIFSTPKIDYSLYEMPISEANPEGAMEYEVILKSKPTTNKIEFTLQDKDVEYFYQPELTQEEKDKGASRPENVIGSYAVYAKTPKTNWTGGKEYKVGKVGHIFRPKIIDSVGSWTWGILNIDNGILSVEIPQEFLDKAVYPVIVDPTFGFTGTGGSNSIVANSSSDTSTRIGYVVAGVDGTLDSLHSMTYDGTTDDTIDEMMFLNIENTGTNSHTEVARVERLELSNPTLGVADWYTFTAAGESISSANNYIMSLLGNGEDAVNNSRRVKSDTTSATNRYTETSTGAGSYAARKESPWTNVSSATIRISIYATYTAGNGVAPVEDPPQIIITD